MAVTDQGIIYWGVTPLRVCQKQKIQAKCGFISVDQIPL